MTEHIWDIVREKRDFGDGYGGFLRAYKCLTFCGIWTPYTSAIRSPRFVARVGIADSDHACTGCALVFFTTVAEGDQ